MREVKHRFLRHSTKNKWVNKKQHKLKMPIQLKVDSEFNKLQNEENGLHREFAPAVQGP